MTPFAIECLGTAVFALIGTAVTCNARLCRNPSSAMSLSSLALGWGAALAIGMFITARGLGGQLNPALTLSLWWVERLTFDEARWRLFGQATGALIGIVLAAVAFIPYWPRASESATKSALYHSAEIRAPISNLLSSIIGSLVLCLVLLRVMAGATLAASTDPGVVGANELPFFQPPFMLTNPAEGALVCGVAFAVMILGVGSTGAPLNPATEVMGRLSHAILPIPGKKRVDWSDTWIAVVGPILGAVLAAAVWRWSVA